MAAGIAIRYGTPSVSAQAVQLSQSTSSFGVRSGSYSVTSQGRVVYVSGFSVCSAPIGVAGQQLQLSSSAIGTFAYTLAADGSRAYFTGGANPSIGASNLYAVQTDVANSQVQLSTPVVSGTSVDSYDVTPDGSRVAYSQILPTGSESWQFKGLFSAPGIVPGTQTRLDSLPLDQQYSARLKIAPGGQSVAYVAGNDHIADRANLYTASMNAGGTQLKKSNDTSTLGTNSFDFWFGPDGNNVVYRPSTMPGTIWSAPASGAGMQVALGTSATIPTAMPDHSGLYFSSPASNSAVGADIFVATPGNVPAKVMLNGSHVAGGEASALLLTPSAKNIVFRADYNVDNSLELFSVSLASPGQHVRLSDPALAGRLVGSLRVGATPSGERAYYTADVALDGVYDLFSAVVGQSGTQVKLNSANNAAHRVELGSAFTSSDGSTLYYTGDLDVDNRFEWYSSSTSVGGTQRRIFTAAQLGHVLSFGVSGDGHWLYYSYDENNTTSSAESLYVMPAAGGPATLLGTSPIAGGSVDGVKLAPDGQTLFFLADAGVLGRKELFSAVVPEPSSVIPAAFVALAALAGRRRRLHSII